MFKLLHLRSSRKATEGFEKKKKFVQGMSWNGYCQILVLGRDPDLRSRPGLVEAGTGWPWL